MTQQTEISVADRAAGALMGAFIGDALALGPHWYYDLDELHARYGEWISDYTAPMPDHYHAGMKAGESSQAGLLPRGTLRRRLRVGRAACGQRRHSGSLHRWTCGTPGAIGNFAARRRAGRRCLSQPVCGGRHPVLDEGLADPNR